MKCVFPATYLSSLQKLQAREKDLETSRKDTERKLAEANFETQQVFPHKIALSGILVLKTIRRGAKVFCSLPCKQVNRKHFKGTMSAIFSNTLKRRKLH